MRSREDIASLESLPGSDFTIAHEEKKEREQESGGTEGHYVFLSYSTTVKRQDLDHGCIRVGTGPPSWPIGYERLM